MKKIVAIFGGGLILSLFFLKPIFAKVGVGVNTGKIQINEKLQAGMVHRLPPITVINTGDEESEYETTISYHQEQKELRPKENWFNFSPSKFTLKPGDGQLVEISLSLPLKMPPGDYFAYLEAHPVAKVQKGNTSLGVAAAAKLYFTVTPSNIFYAIYYKLVGWWRFYTPWSQRIAGIILTIIFLFFFKKFFNVQIGFKKPTSKSSKEVGSSE